MYAEIYISPDPHHRRSGVAFHAMLEAMNEARRNLQSRSGPELRWIANGAPNAGFESASVDRTVDWMIQAGPTSGIVALGLGGEEHGTLPHVFQRVFARAGEAGFHITAHTGITACPERIRQTIYAPKAERIGHGSSARHDPSLLELLGRRNIALELRPAGNLRTGVIPDLESMSLPKMLHAGVPVSISSDDPAFFNTSLEEEYARIVAVFHLTEGELFEIEE